MKTARNLLNERGCTPIPTTCIFIILIAIILIQFGLIFNLYKIIAIQKERIESADIAIQRCSKLHETPYGKDRWDDFDRLYIMKKYYQEREKEERK